MDDSAELQLPAPDDRLDGWKDISTFLGRGVRTAQRWERDLALPIRRLETKGAEVVYAFRAEIDEWRRSREPGRPSLVAEVESDDLDSTSLPIESVAFEHVSVMPTVPAALTTAPRRSRPTVAIALLVLATVGAILWPARYPAASAEFARAATGQPAVWRMEGRTLHVHDAQSRQLWQHVFEFPIDQGVYDAGFALDGQAPPGFLGDLDHDGQVELLVVPWATLPRDRRLYGFRSNGEVMFARPASSSASPGDNPSAGRFVVTQDEAGPAIWLTVSREPELSTVVQKLDITGKLLAEYRHGSEITFLKAAQLGKRRVLLVGGSASDQASASLTLLDYDQPDSAAAPKPFASLTFPALDVARLLSRSPRVDAVEINGDGSLAVSVLQARVIFPLYQSSTQAAVIYAVTPDLRVRSATPSDAYLFAHSVLQLQGHLNHRYGAVPEDAPPSVQ